MCYSKFNKGISAVNGPFFCGMGLWPMAPHHHNHNQCFLYIDNTPGLQWRLSIIHTMSQLTDKHVMLYHHEFMMAWERGVQKIGQGPESLGFIVCKFYVPVNKNA